MFSVKNVFTSVGGRKMGCKLPNASIYRDGVSQGETYEEAMANINDAIRLCIQVIAQDSEKCQPEPLEVRIVELPLQSFLPR